MSGREKNGPDLGNAGAPGRPMTVGVPLAQLAPARFDPEALETLRAAAAGDRDAVRALYRGHVDRVHRLVARILGSSDPDIDDVVQRVFLAALDSAESFVGRSPVSTWLLGIASRRALDAARARWRRDRWRRLTERVGLGQAPARPDVRLETQSRAAALMQRLNPDQRTVFLLKEVEGYTLKEIHLMTGVGISTLHARLKAARRRLDAALATGDDND